jgi:hypothetical protein
MFVVPQLRQAATNGALAMAFADNLSTEEDKVFEAIDLKLQQMRRAAWCAAWCALIYLLSLHYIGLP